MLPWTTAFNVSDFPSYRKLIRYLLPLPLLEPKSKVLSFSYFFLFLSRQGILVSFKFETTTLSSLEILFVGEEVSRPESLRAT